MAGPGFAGDLGFLKASGVSIQCVAGFRIYNS